MVEGLALGMEGPIEISLEGPIELDLGAVKDEPVAQGWHTVQIERADAKLSAQQEIPMIFVLSRIIEESDPQVKKTVIWNNMMQGEGLIFTKRCFKALGLPEKLVADSLQDLADTLVGLQVQVQIKHKVHEGEIQANVKNWQPVTFG